MILCLTNISYKNLNFKKFLSVVKLLNLKNIEIAPSLLSKKPFSKKDLKKTKLLLNKFNIKIKSFQSIFFDTNENYQNKKNGTNYLINHFKKIVNLASKLDVKNLSIGSCPSRLHKENSSLIYDLNLDLFKKFSQIAEKKRITISLEPVSKKYGIYFLNDIDEVFNFVKKLNKKNVKILLDTGNCKLEKMNYKKKFKKYKKFINHVQISNQQIDNFNIGVIKKELAFFKSVNFKKTLTIEHFSNSLNKLKLNQKIVEKIVK
jgi:sugar phosphate isomerase/epimerase